MKTWHSEKVVDEGPSVSVAMGAAYKSAVVVGPMTKIRHYQVEVVLQARSSIHESWDGDGVSQVEKEG